MKLRPKYWILLIFSFFLTLIHPTIAYAGSSLDEIQQYKITVDVRNDGTLDMDYSIQWKVLDSDSEGPLEWVKIGIPNKHVDEITALTDNIKKIKYYSEYGETFVRIDFDRAYYADEIVSFSFHIHQSYMYCIDDETSEVSYNFTPGWFDEIAVKSLQIKWNETKALRASSDHSADGYYTWNTSLEKGDRYDILVVYPKNAYDFQYDAQQSNVSSSDGMEWLLVVLVVVILFIAFIAFAVKNSNDYHGGFGGGRGGYRRRNTFVSNTGRHSGCVRSSCACACACACAGGGRAGCSIKDFYGTNLQTNALRKIIQKKTRKI